MKHRIFTILSAISLLLVAVLALWTVAVYLGAQEYLSTIQVGVGAAPTQYDFGVDSRTLELTRYRFLTNLVPDFTSSWHCMGFSWESRPTGFVSGAVIIVRQSSLRIPFWALLVVFGIMPTWWLLAYRRRRMAGLRRGHCPICDYDLRASKERCPECGTPIAQPESAKQTERTV